MTTTTTTPPHIVPHDWRPARGAAIIDVRQLLAVGGATTLRVVSEHASITDAADAWRPGYVCQIVTSRGDYFVVDHESTKGRGIFYRDSDCHMPAPRGRLLFFVGGPLRDRQGHLSAEEEAAYE